MIVTANTHDLAQVSILRGATPTLIADNLTLGNLPNTAGWEHKTLDLTAFIGGPIQVQFRFAADVAFQTEGWHVDDVVVQIGSPTVAITAGAGSLKNAIDIGNFRVVSAGADRTVNEGQLVSLTSVFSDPNPANGSNITRLWQVVASNGQIIPNGTASTFNFTPNDNGTYTVTHTITDLDDGGRQYVDTVVVVARNVAPVVNLGANRVINEGALLAFANPATDVSGDTLTYRWERIDANGQVTIVGTGSTLSLPTNDNATFTIRVTVTDDDGAVSTDEALVTIQNVAPQNVNAGVDRVVTEGTPVSLSGSFTDPGTLDTQSLLWHVTSTNGQVITDGTQSTFNFTPTDNGTYTVTFTGTDDDGGANSDVVVVTVNNVAPQNVNAGADRNVGERTAVPLSVTFTDPGTLDTQAIAWSVTRNAQPFASGVGTSFTFTPSDEGTYLVTVTVTDSDGGSAVATVNVFASNVAPTASAGGPYNVVEGGSLTVAATVADVGGDDVLSVSWDINGDNNFSDATGLTPSFTWAQLNALGITNGPATFNVRARVSDGDSFPVTSTATTLTLSNAPPTNVQITRTQPVGEMLEGTLISLAGSFTDFGVNEPHTFSWQATSTNGQTVATQSGNIAAGGTVPAFSFTPTGDGLYTARLSIGDGQQSASGLSTLGVGNVLPLSLNLVASNAVPVGQSLTVTGNFTDPGSDTWQATLVVRESGQQGVLLRLPLALDGQSFATSLVFSQASTLELTYEIDDGAGMSTSQPVVVSIGDRLQGDINSDGRVDLHDLAILQRNFGLGSGASASQGDWNGDGAVNRGDLAILVKNFGRTLARQPPAAAPAAIVAQAVARGSNDERISRMTQPLGASVVRRRMRGPAPELDAPRVDQAIESYAVERTDRIEAKLRARRGERRVATQHAPYVALSSFREETEEK